MFLERCRENPCPLRAQGRGVGRGHLKCLVKDRASGDPRVKGGQPSLQTECPERGEAGTRGAAGPLLCQAVGICRGRCLGASSPGLPAQRAWGASLTSQRFLQTCNQASSSRKKPSVTHLPNSHRPIPSAPLGVAGIDRLLPSAHFMFVCLVSVTDGGQEPHREY